jgi:hypothetical protein
MNAIVCLVLRTQTAHGIDANTRLDRPAGQSEESRILCNCASLLR